MEITPPCLLGQCGKRRKGKEGAGRDTVECNSVTRTSLDVVVIVLVMPPRRPCSQNVTFLRHSISTDKGRNVVVIMGFWIWTIPEKERYDSWPRTSRRSFVLSAALSMRDPLVVCENFANSISPKEHNIPDSDWVDSLGDDG